MRGECLKIRPIKLGSCAIYRRIGISPGCPLYELAALIILRSPGARIWYKLPDKSGLNRSGKVVIRAIGTKANTLEPQ